MDVNQETRARSDIQGEIRPSPKGRTPPAGPAETITSERTASPPPAALGTPRSGPRPSARPAAAASEPPAPAIAQQTASGPEGPASASSTHAERGRGWIVGGVVYAATAMFLVGTLASVSSLITDYPVYGGQAVRYAVAAAILLVVARRLAPARAPEGEPAPAREPDTARERSAAPERLTARRRTATRERLTLREWALLGALSATGLVIFNVAVIESARAAGPTLAGTVLGTVPLVLALAGGGRPSPRLVAAAAVVVAGTTLATGLGSGNPTGLAWALVALACEVCFSLLALPLLPGLGAVRVSAYSCALAVPLLVVVGLAVDGGGFLRLPTAAQALGLAYLSLVITTVAFLLWYTGLPRLGPQRAGLFAGLIPVGALVTTVVLGLGVPGTADLAGAGLVILGIVMGLNGGVVPSRKT